MDKNDRADNDSQEPQLTEEQAWAAWQAAKQPMALNPSEEHQTAEVVAWHRLESSRAARVVEAAVAVTETAPGIGQVSGAYQRPRPRRGRFSTK